MANAIKLEIQNDKGKWCTWNNVAVPVKYGMLLDEQLDFATVSLMRVRKREFKPLTRARLTIESKTESGGTQGGIINGKLEYFIANDDFYEAPVGSGMYNHELTLIEPTKLLECFPLETLCFTHPGKHDTSLNAPAPVVTEERYGVYPGDEFFNKNDVQFFHTPTLLETVYRLPNLSGLGAIGEDECIVSITNGQSKLEYNSWDYNNGLSFDDITFTIGEGANIITYTYRDYYTKEIYGIQTFTIYGLENKYPYKPWTINDVIQRILQLVEPLRRGQKQRFTFTPPQGAKAKVFEQIAPEFTFTRQTLREALQTVGGFIHAEPRLNIDYNGDLFITFDFYGEQEYAEYTNYKTQNRKRLSKYKYKTLKSKYGLEQATTKLDSYQDNLVNRVAWDSATIGQPYKGGVQTLRTETAYIRGEEQDNYLFPTTHNIDKVVKFEYINEKGAWDITPYVYEHAPYNYLSSYDEKYPSSKSYALYYTNAGKGINGFFYKAPSKFGGGIGNNYAIVNIIKAVTGKDFNGEYQDMRFRLTYVPIYSTRVQQSKAYLNDYLPLPRILNYTQSDNSVETRYFGEHIKAAVSRMGNVEKTYTLNLRNFYNIPKAGQLWDDDYYIANVSVGVNADMFEVSVGLSKNFNRKSQYIGASSYKRMYEVSETMVQERHTVYTDYLVITDEWQQTISENYTFLREDGVKAIASVFNAPEEGKDYSIVSVEACGSGKSILATLQEKVLLPVVASAFGNAMEFTWEYKDNFSAGVKSEYKESSDGVHGTFGVEVEYTDYYGRLYCYYFSLLTDEQTKLFPSISPDKLPELQDTTLVYGMAGLEIGQDEPLIERKDNREKPKKSYVVEFVTDKQEYIIGSALASYNPLVSYNKHRRQPHLYILPYRVNKFATNIDLSAEGVIDMGAINVTTSTAYGLSFGTMGVLAEADGFAWAYAIPPYIESMGVVEDENGVVEELKIEKGGEVLLAKNRYFSKNQRIGDFTAVLVHDVYNYMKAKK